MGFLDGLTGLDSAKGLIALTSTTLITDENIQTPPWSLLSDDYKRTEPTAELVCAISVLNSALTHNRRWFVMTRDKVEKLVRTDLNWKGKAVFNNKLWAKYLKFMYVSGILKQTERIGKITVYELTFDPILAFLPASDCQRQETLEFAEQKLNGKSKNKSDFQEPAMETEKSQSYDDDDDPIYAAGKLKYEEERKKHFASFKWNGTDDDLIN